MSLLNTPIMVKNMRLSNRLVMPPIETNKADGNGKVTKKLCEYYSEKSNGAYIGLIITEHSYISQEGKASKNQLSISDEKDIDGLQKLVETIHLNHSKVMAQISHAGGATRKEIIGCRPLSAYTIKMPNMSVTEPLPQEMEKTDIKKVIYDFAKAAMRAKKAGFDGVEIHAAHGYLLNQFFSPLTNKRSDEYSGNSFSGRIRLAIEVIEAVRNIVGADYPIAVRLGACDYMEGGISLKDGVLAAKEFEQAGVDLLDISGGFCDYIRPDIKAQGYFSEITEEIKKDVSIPVILTGGITDAEVAENLLKMHKTDLVGVGRAILKDSEWAKKAMQSLA